MLFYVTIFISSFLLFQVQPVIARMILPWFGNLPRCGAPAALLQAVLVLGYLYAHATTRLRPAAQAGLRRAAGDQPPAAPIVPDALETDRRRDHAAHPGAAGGHRRPSYLVLSTRALLQAWYAASAAGKRP